MVPFAAFGKIPALGDFIRIAAPPAFTGPRDQWVQAVLVAGRAACGRDWQDIYLSAPIWRFTLSPGLAGPQGVLGIIMPSVDQVGRQFPLTLFIPAGSDASATHAANAALFARLEDVALEALGDGVSRDDLAAALADLPPPVLATPVAPPLRALSLWSVLLADGVRTVTFFGLPSAAQAAGLFDLSVLTRQAQQAEDLAP
ncbi:type VI secretion system-associated protein TagF [Loktanella sp. DJP18]|uniref:type VI secretion system-associated protein TagF n=1 Tax=Loktanella sp. DJP18 TaxID=3409788 RepID=UPI003BB6AB48